jgi:hypothetical protein
MSVARLFFFLLFSDVAVSGTAVMNASSAIALVWYQTTVINQSGYQEQMWLVDFVTVF